MRTTSNADADGTIRTPSALRAAGNPEGDGAAGKGAAGEAGLRRPLFVAGEPEAEGEAVVYAAPNGRSGEEPEADQDTGDLPTGVDEDELDEDELDTDRVTSPEAIAAAIRLRALRLEAKRARLLRTMQAEAKAAPVEKDGERRGAEHVDPVLR